MLKGHNFQQEKGKKNGQSYHAWLQRRQGQVITKMAKDMDGLTIVAGIDLKNDKENGYPVYPSLEECKEEADVVVDLLPQRQRAPYGFCSRKKLAMCFASPGAF